MSAASGVSGAQTIGKQTVKEFCADHAKKVDALKVQHKQMAADRGVTLPTDVALPKGDHAAIMAQLETQVRLMLGKK